MLDDGLEVREVGSREFRDPELEGGDSEEVEEAEEGETDEDLATVWTREGEMTVVAIGGRRMGVRVERLHSLMRFAVVPLR